MVFILLFYYISYIIFLFGIIPLNALLILRPIGIILITLIFIFFIKLIKKKYFRFFIFLLNAGFFIVLKEFSRVSYKPHIVLFIITTIALVLILKKKPNTKISISIFLILLLLGAWPGVKFKYKSNISPESLNENYISFDYGLKSKIQTYSVDSSNFYKGNKGLANIYDKIYWNFTTNLPLSGRVVQPTMSGKFPIIFIVHGNALAEIPSHLGYDYLLKHFANNGYVAVSVDETFLNGNWTTLGAGQYWENDARGILLLKHIELFSKWNSDKSSILYNKIDLDNIGLIGHSRGGEAVSIAASYSDNYKIKAVMSLAGTDGQFNDKIKLINSSYIALQGANDGDSDEFKTRAQFNRTYFTDNTFNIKATYYIEGLNHAQFNTNWGNYDAYSLGKLFYGKNNNIDSVDQQEVAKVIGLTFFDTVLKNRYEKIDLLKNPKKIKTMPEITVITDYSDSNYSEDTREIIIENGSIKPVYNYNDRFYNVKINNDSRIVLENRFNNLKSIMFSIANSNYYDINLTANFLKNNIIIKSRNEFINRGIPKITYKLDILKLHPSIEPNFQFYELPIEENLQWDELELLFENNKSLDSNILFNSFFYK